jgi:hypothetical protein
LSQITARYLWHTGWPSTRTACDLYRRSQMAPAVGSDSRASSLIDTALVLTACLIGRVIPAGRSRLITQPGRAAGRAHGGNDLQIRSSGQVVQDRPLRSVRWADIPGLSIPGGCCLPSWQQYWQQSQWPRLDHREPRFRSSGLLAQVTVRWVSDGNAEPGPTSDRLGVLSRSARRVAREISGLCPRLVGCLSYQLTRGQS